VWTAVDWFERFGPIRSTASRTNPPPGSATEQDVIDIHDHENRLCELLEALFWRKPWKL